MATRRLTDSDQWIITNALRAAADAYKRDAESEVIKRAGLSQQFHDQRTAALAIAERLEGAAGIDVHEQTDC